MATFSIWHGLIVLVILVVFAFGIWLNVRILHKAGFSGWWSVLMLVPIVNLVMIWVFAYVRWPSLEAAGQHEQAADGA